MLSYESFNDAINLTVSEQVTCFFNTSRMSHKINSFNEGYIVNASCDISTIKLTSIITSLPVSPFPAIYPEDSDAETMQKVLEHEKIYPKFGLEFFIRIDNKPWLLVGRKILFNRNTVATTDCLMPNYTRSGSFEFSVGTELGYKFKNLGNGLPTSEDKFTVLLSGKEQYYLQFRPTRTVKNAINFKVELNANTSTLIRPLVTGRKAITVTNSSADHPCWLSFGSVATIGEGLFIAPHGSYSWEVSSYTLDLPIYAISNNNISLSGSEFYI